MLQPGGDGQAQRRRSVCVPARRARAHQRPSAGPARGVAADALEAGAMTERTPPMRDAVLIDALNNATSLELYQLARAGRAADDRSEADRRDPQGSAPGTGRSRLRRPRRRDAPGAHRRHARHAADGPGESSTASTGSCRMRPSSRRRPDDPQQNHRHRLNRPPKTDTGRLQPRREGVVHRPTPASSCRRHHPLQSEDAPAWPATTKPGTFPTQL